MKFATLTETETAGETVLLRVDFNSPIDPASNIILDDKRFREHAPTVQALGDAKCVVITHQSRPLKKDFTTLEAHAARLERLIGRPVTYIDDIFGLCAREAVEEMETGDVLMLENVRFNAEENLKMSGEEALGTHLVRNLAAMGSLYVNDAFGTAHRSQPTIVGLPRAMPAVAGLLMEKEIAWRIESLARQKGADDLAFPSIVASGPNGALPHAVPSRRKIREKEPIVFDVGIRLNGYRSDMTRTIFLGDPGPKFRKIYRTVRKAQLAALEVVLPGIKSTFPDSVARDLIKEAGFGEYFGHALGHGVGLATHERPRLSPRNPVELKEGMILTVEPGIYLPGRGGVRLEETVVIEKDGPRILTMDAHLYDF